MSMHPELVRAESLSRIVGNAGAVRQRLTLGNVDRHRYLAGLVRFVRIDYAHGIEQAALDERLACALDFARIEASAALPVDPPLDIAALDALQTFNRDRAEIRRRPRLDGIRH